MGACGKLPAAQAAEVSGRRGRGCPKLVPASSSPFWKALDSSWRFCPFLLSGSRRFRSRAGLSQSQAVAPHGNRCREKQKPPACEGTKSSSGNSGTPTSRPARLGGRGGSPGDTDSPLHWNSPRLQIRVSSCPIIPASELDGILHYENSNASDVPGKTRTMTSVCKNVNKIMSMQVFILCSGKTPKKTQQKV